MTKGKYGERAKTKRAADGATAVALAEQNRLRARIRTLEHLEGENRHLRERLDDARRQMDAKEGDELKRMRQIVADSSKALLEASRTVEEVITFHKAQDLAIITAIRESGIPRKERIVILAIINKLAVTAKEPWQSDIEDDVMIKAHKDSSRSAPKRRGDTRFIFSKRRLSKPDWLRRQWLVLAEAREKEGGGLVTKEQWQHIGTEMPSENPEKALR